MPISSNSLTIAYGTAAPNEVYTVGYANNFKEKLINPSGLAYWDIYTNSSKTSSGQLIAPRYETLNFNGGPVSNSNINTNFLITNSYDSWGDWGFTGSASDEYVILSKNRYDSSFVREYVLYGGLGNDNAYLPVHDYELSKIQKNSIGISKVSTLDITAYLVGFESFDTHDTNYKLPGVNWSVDSATIKNHSYGYVGDIDNNYGSYGGLYYDGTNGDDLRVFLGNKTVTNFNGQGGNDIFLITEYTSTDITTWTFTSGSWYLYLPSGNFTFTNTEYIQFSDKVVKLNNNGTRQDILFTDINSTPKARTVDNLYAKALIAGPLVQTDITGNQIDYQFYNIGAERYGIRKKESAKIDEITGLASISISGTIISISQDIQGVFDQVTGRESQDAQAFRLYNAAFARFPDSSGLRYWINEYKSGISSYRTIAQSFINSNEFALRYGANNSNEEFTNNMYKNVLGRLPDASGLAYWVGNLNSGTNSRVDVLGGFSESAENKILFSQVTGFI